MLKAFLTRKSSRPVRRTERGSRFAFPSVSLERLPPLITASICEVPKRPPFDERALAKIRPLGEEEARSGPAENRTRTRFSFNAGGVA